MSKSDHFWDLYSVRNSAQKNVFTSTIRPTILTILALESRQIFDEPSLISIFTYNGRQLYYFIIECESQRIKPMMQASNYRQYCRWFLSENNTMVGTDVVWWCYFEIIFTFKPFIDISWTFSGALILKRHKTFSTLPISKWQRRITFEIYTLLGRGVNSAQKNVLISTIRPTNTNNIFSWKLTHFRRAVINFDSYV